MARPVWASGGASGGASVGVFATPPRLPLSAVLSFASLIETDGLADREGMGNRGGASVNLLLCLDWI